MRNVDGQIGVAAYADFQTAPLRQASVTISGDLIHHVRKLYELALEEVVRRHPDREALRPTFIKHPADGPPLLPLQSLNGETSAAIPGYILAVTAVEAFLNEAFLSNSASFLTGHSIAESARQRLEGLNLKACTSSISGVGVNNAFTRSVRQMAPSPAFDATTQL